MRDHLAHNERLADRLRYFIGDGTAARLGLGAADRATWLDLVREAELLARCHREALEAVLDAS